ncbi:CaiB/BaiF CoA transferase family protein [Phaeacidiphilus oryzae]|uniref:CaiB/BaiF CoA transferase family protein n=1 Tax=Phaeacidiphilus oryzae TaxID=348818 RepID=UPI00068AE933|nr:CoA transferase [Phaeacidiphilus oryzae]
MTAHPQQAPAPPLAGVRIIECSMLGPAAVTSALVDLGAEVVKVEPPQGDYGRRMTWPIVEGTSLLHLHVNRGKRSVVLDLRTPEGIAVFKELVAGADVVVEAMRPGGLERRGVGYRRLLEVNPRLVFCTISGYGATGPYRDLPSHGIAYDTWAGIVTPGVTEDGHTYISEHTSIGINAGPLYGALGILAALLRARETGVGAEIDIAQSDSAAAVDWLRSETYKAYERPESEVTGNAADGYQRRAPGIAGMKEGVRYQIYRTKDGFVLFMASERSLWRNFCTAVGRPDFFERWPGSQYGDHARGNTELREELRDIFAGRTSAEWIDFGERENVPIAPVNTPRTLLDDPQLKARMPLLPKEELGADQLPTPLRFVGEELPHPARAPEVGQHTEAVLRELLGYDDARLAELRSAGALGASGPAPAEERERAK